jgi:hypothetical protein
MMQKLQHIQARARKLAWSGKFFGWRPIAFELRFEPGFTDASQWINSPSAQEELDDLCDEARKRAETDPEVA